MVATADPPDADLGHGHTLRWVAWSPDRSLNPRYAGIPDVERWGATVEHVRYDGELCRLFITFAQPAEYAGFVGDEPVWEIVNSMSLTIHPSLSCRACGDHGWIQGGAWLPA
jgi:hypothetical protein